MDDMRQKYLADSDALADQLQGMLEAAVGQKFSRYREMYGLELQLTLNKPGISVVIKPQYAGITIRSKRLTGDFYLLANIAGNKSKHPRRKDGTFNLAEIVERAKINTDHQVAYETAQKEAEIHHAESERIKAEELSGIEIPPGVKIERHAQSGDYGIRVEFWRNGIPASEVRSLLEALKPFLSPVKA